MKYWRNHRIRGWREYVAFLSLMFVIFGCGVMMFAFSVVKAQRQVLGVTFSDSYAQTLGLNSQEAFTALLDDVGVRDVRIPVYWHDVEKNPGEYDFSRIDALMSVAESRGASVTLVLGMKVPRWPECYIPSFIDASSPTFDASVLRYVQMALLHFRSSSAVVRWQVENEPIFPYGNCPSPSIDRLKKEVALVRALDQRPVLLTVSGEQEPWLDLASLGDQIGFSVYRFAYNSVLGPFAFPHTAFYYRLHSFVTGFFAKQVVISELQMEPWFTGNPQDAGSLDVAFTSNDFVRNLRFAREIGAPEALLWGAEWWYFEHVRGNDDLWNAARDAFSSQR